MKSVVTTSSYFLQNCLVSSLCYRIHMWILNYKNAANSRYYESQLGYINEIACISRCSHVPTIGGTDCVEEKIRNREARKPMKTSFSLL